MGRGGTAALFRLQTEPDSATPATSPIPAATTAATPAREVDEAGRAQHSVSRPSHATMPWQIVESQ